jgi:hypothetical protein
MSHHKDHDAPDRPDGLPPLFAALDAILHRDVQRILKDLPGFLEAHTVMLALIGAVFRLVPFKSDAGPGVYVIMVL